MTDREVGSMIRNKRQKRGWSQQELAKRLGVTWEMVSRYERGKSSALQKILQIADVLEIEVSELLGGQRPFGNFTDASAEYLNSRFIPVLSYMPDTAEELITLLSGTEIGTRVYDNGEGIEKFGLRLGPDSKVRIATGAILPKGILVCSLALGDLSEHAVVLVARNNLVSLEQYQAATKAKVLARVIEWVVKF